MTLTPELSLDLLEPLGKNADLSFVKQDSDISIR